jgi:hypothetical protein
VRKVSAEVGEGRHLFPVVPTGPARAKLARRGKLRVTVTVSFETAAGTATMKRSVVLRLARGR